MKLFQLTAVIFYLYIIIIRGKGFERRDCESIQYIRADAEEIIKCSFGDDVFGVLWYNSKDFYQVDAIITLKDSVKGGEGFNSGEFDIYPNGSLIISNVSLKHEGTYTVIKLDTPTSNPKAYTINVFVFAHTFERVPIIEGCEGCDHHEMCFQTAYPNSQISCILKDARPAIPLTWMVRTTDGDRNTSSRSVITNETNIYFTSRTTTPDPFAYSDILTLLVCKADTPSGLLQRNESLVLLQNSEETPMNIEPKQIVLEVDSTVQLHCNYGKISYLVWQVKQFSETVFKTILYAAFVGRNFSHINDKDYKLQQTSLVIDKIRMQDEGSYRCVSGNGLEDSVIVYNVIVFVNPDPPYLVVDGCSHQHYCVLEVQPQGILTCTVERIYPQVNLDITEVLKQSSYDLNFYDKSLTTSQNGDTFDVIITAKYRFNGATGTRVTVECNVVGTNIVVLQLSTKFDLWLIEGAESTTDDNTSSDGHSYWIIAVVLAVVLVLLVLCVILLFKVRGIRSKKRKGDYSKHRNINLGGREKGIKYLNGDKNEEKTKKQLTINPEEVIPMIGKGHFQGKKNMFISQLKAKYQDLYDAVQPIPYIRDRLYCVDRVFVEGGIEYLVAKDRIGGQGTWDKLCSYHNILDDDRVKSTRRIIEGEPGYGKSTLTLQLSYDWCNKIPLSYLKDIDLLILLRLRQLGGVTSVYRAIKQFLLPKDSKLTESDIADIISECSSVLVILDGYDEYPDQDVNVNSDVISIIMRHMFQQFEVVLTTRSSYLPKKYPAMTKRLKLTGFDDNARNQYIRKAVVGDDVIAAQKIKQRLKENPVLGDLCQVPLFFVMFAHMSHESEKFEKITSVTSFFRYMISCFYSHMKNKTEDENVKKCDLFETEHPELDKLAFEGLSRKDQQIVWSKHYMCERLGQDFYDQYVRTGILVEEEVLDISDDPNTIISEHIQYKTEVRFYHKLFCEWYAAHHLSKYLSKDYVIRHPWGILKYRDYTVNQTEHYLKYLDPFDLQYVYRFTCGLNCIAADKIIGYLKTSQGAKKFAILCILEKSGVEDVLKDVKELCSGTVGIKADDTSLLQRSVIQLLEIATSNKISISCVRLYNCYSTVDLRGGNHLQLKSNLSIPVLTTLNELWIDTLGEGREITSEEFTGILQYSSKCLALKKLLFWYCLLPRSVQTESVSVLRSRNVKVTWYAPSYTKYQLNLQSCLWELIDYDIISGTSRRVIRVMTDDDYQNEVRKFRGDWGET